MNILKKHREAVYIIIGLIGLILIAIIIVADPDQFNPVILNIGTELVGATIIFLVLSYFLLERNLDRSNQCEIVEASKQTVIEECLKAEKRLWIKGLPINLVKDIFTSDQFEELLESGVDVRFLTIQEDSSNAESVGIYLGTSLPSRATNNMPAIEHEIQSKGGCVGIVDTPITVAYFIIDPESHKGQVFVMPYRYKKTTDNFAFKLSILDNEKWANGYIRDFRKLWEIAEKKPTGC